MSKQHTLWQTLSCDLTQDEINTYSQELAAVTTEQAQIEAHKKDVMSSITARLNKCAADRMVLANKITSRKEDRNVECDLDFDYAKGMVYTVRTDTGVTIKQRKLSDDERQQWLDLDAEEGRRQEAEDKRNDNAQAPPIIDGEILQIEHKPETEADVCPKCEGEGMYIEDGIEDGGGEIFCDCPAGISAQEADKPTDPICHRCHEAHPSCGACCELCDDKCNSWQTCMVKEAELVECARRDEICKEWRFCNHKDRCFAPENEEAGICFVDSPESLTKVVADQKKVNSLTNTSADDCKTSLHFVTDIDVLHAALEQCTINGQKTSAKHISARINQLAKAVQQ